MTTGILTEVTLRSGETYIVNLAVLPNIGDTLFLYEPSETEDTESEEILNKILKEFHFVSYFNHTPTPHKYFQKADLHLFLTHRDGFGNVAIEAAACGTPTFCYDISGLKDSVEQDVSGHRFQFQDYTAIADKINEASANKEMFLMKYRDASNWAISNFNSFKVWDRYLDFYLKDNEK